MKIRKSSRVVAIALALMMIVPLISVPAFAEEAATPLFNQDFTGATVADALQKNPYNNSPVIKDIGGTHGEVMYYDMTKGPSATRKDDAEGTLYLSPNHRDTWYKVTEVYIHPVTGLATGIATIKDNEGQPIDILFQDAVINTEGFKTPVTILTGSMESTTGDSYWMNETEDDFLYDEEGEIIPGPGVVTVGETPSGIATTWSLTTAQVRNAIQGGESNIAVHTYLKHDALTAGNVVTYSADYYFDEGWNANAENHALGGKFRLLSITKNENNIRISQHGNNTMTSGSAVQVATGTWFNITIVADYSTAQYTVYVNGNEAFTAQDSGNAAAIQAAAGTVTANSWNLLQVNRGQDVCNYHGYFMVDNCAIYDGTVLPAQSKVLSYVASKNFNNGGLNITNAGATADNKYNASGDKAFITNVDTNGSTANNAAPMIDQSVYLKDGGTNLSYKDTEVVVLEADYYFPSTTYAQVQSQIQQYDTTTAGVTNKYWLPIYTIVAKGGDVSLKAPNGENYLEGATVYQSKLPADEWFTLSTVIEMDTCIVRQYVNGVQINEWQLFRVVFFENLSFNTAKFIYSKLNKNNSSFPNGYVGEYAVDNVEVFTDVDLIKNYQGIRDDRFFSNDYEDKTVGTTAESAVAGGPTSATFTDLLGNTAIKFDMVPNMTGKPSRATADFFGGPNARLYLLTGIEDDPTFDPENVDTSKLTTIGSSYGATDKQIQVARKGNKAYAYELSGSFIGAYDIISKDAENAEGIYEAMIGGYNTDKMFKAAHSTWRYINAANAINTFVLSADYYIPADAIGKMESQFNTGKKYYNFYAFDFGTGAFQSQLGANTVGTFNKDAWNNVTTILTITASGATADVYLNGVYTHRQTYDITSFDANCWSVAKIGKNFSTNPATANAGSFYLDNVSASKLDASKVKNIDVSTAMEVTLGGKAIQLPNLSGKFYTDKEVVVVKTWNDVAANYANLVSTETVASIRLTDPTGLRFATKIDMALLEELQGQVKSVQFGTLITKTEIANVKGLPNFEDTANWVVGSTMLDVKAVDGVYNDRVDNDPETTHITGSIVNIKESNITAAFTGIGYAKVTLNSGAVVYIYSATSYSISVAEQAQKTLDTGIYQDGSAAYKILYEYASKLA